MKWLISNPGVADNNCGELADSDGWRFVNLSTKVTDAAGVSTTETNAFWPETGFLHIKTQTGTNAPSITTTQEYENQDLNGWVWRLKKEFVNGLTGTGVTGKVKETTYLYHSGSSGNLNKQTDWNDHGPDSVTTYGDYEYGNPKTTIDPRENTTTMIYNAATATYPATVTYPSPGSGVVHSGQKKGVKSFVVLF